MELSKVRIVADSGSDTVSLEGVDFALASLKIVAGDKEYSDDAALCVEDMVNFLASYKGKSSTACPGPGDYISAFGDAQYVFCMTITSNLSGSYNSATIAKKDYEEQYEGRRVRVIDSLSAGPEMVLIIEKLRELILSGKSFDEVSAEIDEYMKKTGLIFVLESMQNLANNGRVSPLAAKAAGLLGIRAIGRASEMGTLEMLTKSRGEKRAAIDTYTAMKDHGYKGGSVRIGNVVNPEFAESVKKHIVEEYPDADVKIYGSRGLCSFYHYFEGKDGLLGSLAYLFDEKYEELEDKLPEGSAMEQLLFLNRQLFKMIEDEIDIELLTKLYSTQLVTKGEKQLTDHNRVYYKLLRKIVQSGQASGEITDKMSVSELVRIYAMCERALIYDWCLMGGSYPLSQNAQSVFPGLIAFFAKK